MAYFQKTPAGADYWSIDWTDDLTPGEVVSTSSWFLDPGLTEDTHQDEATVSTIYVSGGVDGTVYRIRCVMTTTTDRILEQAIFLGVHP